VRRSASRPRACAWRRTSSHSRWQSVHLSRMRWFWCSAWAPKHPCSNTVDQAGLHDPDSFACSLVEPRSSECAGSAAEPPGDAGGPFAGRASSGTEAPIRGLPAWSPTPVDRWQRPSVRCARAEARLHHRVRWLLPPATPRPGAPGPHLAPRCRVGPGPVSPRQSSDCSELPSCALRAEAQFATGQKVPAPVGRLLVRTSGLAGTEVPVWLSVRPGRPVVRSRPPGPRHTAGPKPCAEPWCSATAPSGDAALGAPRVSGTEVPGLRDALRTATVFRPRRLRHRRRANRGSRGSGVLAVEPSGDAIGANRPTSVAPSVTRCEPKSAACRSNVATSPGGAPPLGASSSSCAEALVVPVTLRAVAIVGPRRRETSWRWAEAHCALDLVATEPSGGGAGARGSRGPCRSAVLARRRACYAVQSTPAASTAMPHGPRSDRDHGRATVPSGDAVYSHGALRRCRSTGPATRTAVGASRSVPAAFALVAWQAEAHEAPLRGTAVPSGDITGPQGSVAGTEVLVPPPTRLVTPVRWTRAARTRCAHRPKPATHSVACHPPVGRRGGLPSRHDCAATQALLAGSLNVIPGMVHCGFRSPTGRSRLCRHPTLPVPRGGHIGLPNANTPARSASQRWGETTTPIARPRQLAAPASPGPKPTRRRRRRLPNPQAVFAVRVSSFPDAEASAWPFARYATPVVRPLRPEAWQTQGRSPWSAWCSRTTGRRAVVCAGPGSPGAEAQAGPPDSIHHQRESPGVFPRGVRHAEAWRTSVGLDTEPSGDTASHRVDGCRPKAALPPATWACGAGCTAARRFYPTPGASRSSHPGAGRNRRTHRETPQQHEPSLGAVPKHLPATAEPLRQSLTSAGSRRRTWRTEVRRDVALTPPNPRDDTASGRRQPRPYPGARPRPP
jgi:hypothetical protein